MHILNATRYDGEALLRLLAECYRRILETGNRGQPVSDYTRRSCAPRWELATLRMVYGTRHGARLLSGVHWDVKELLVTLPQKHADNRAIVQAVETPLRRLMGAPGTTKHGPQYRLTALDKQPWMDVLLGSALLPLAAQAGLREQEIGDAEIAMAHRDVEKLSRRHERVQKQLKRLHTQVEIKERSLATLAKHLDEARTQHQALLDRIGGTHGSD